MKKRMLYIDIDQLCSLLQTDMDTLVIFAIENQIPYIQLSARLYFSDDLIHSWKKQKQECN